MWSVVSAAPSRASPPAAGPVAGPSEAPRPRRQVAPDIVERNKKKRLGVTPVAQPGQAAAVAASPGAGRPASAPNAGAASSAASPRAVDDEPSSLWSVVPVAPSRAPPPAAGPVAGPSPGARRPARAPAAGAASSASSPSAPCRATEASAASVRHVLLQVDWQDAPGAALQERRGRSPDDEHRRRCSAEGRSAKSCNRRRGLPRSPPQSASRNSP